MTPFIVMTSMVIQLFVHFPERQLFMFMILLMTTRSILCILQYARLIDRYKNNVITGEFIQFVPIGKLLHILRLSTLNEKL